MRHRHLFAITGTVMAMTAATASAAGGPTGNPQAVAFAQTVKRATDKLHVFTYRQTGYVSLDDQEGKSSFFQWRWASGVVPKGWTKATEQATVVAKNGRLVWWRDALTPGRCTGAGICHRIPVVVLVNHRGSFFTFGTPGNHTCYGTLSGTYTHVGDPIYTVAGDFSAPVTRPRSVLLNYSYPWTSTQTATETDTVSTRTDLTTSGVTHVASGGQGNPGFTISFRYGYPAKAPPAPKVTRCKG